MSIIQNIKRNWKAGLTVSLVSIPLSISLAVASRATPTAGIITAIWAGLIAAIFGGSNFNIIGPTGALSGIIALYVAAHGVDTLATLTITTGLFILLAYFLKLERYLLFIPSSVVHGFTLGVAFIIGLNQLPFALGLKNIPQHERFFDNVIESLHHLSETTSIALVIFLSFFLGLVLLRIITPKIPGAILLAPIGIMLGYASKTHLIPITIQTLGDKFSDITFKLFTMPSFSLPPHIISTAALIALIAVLETMLSANIADSMTHTKHNQRKEMLGLGLANLASGFTGGIPATAALARTSLNIKAHATHKTSAIISVIGVAFISFFLLAYFAYIPLAVIAAILVYVSVQMVEAEHFKTFYKYDRINFWVSMAVAAATLYKDPIIGILLGATISLMFLVDKISRGQCDIKVNRHNGEIVGALPSEKNGKNHDVVMYSIKGKLCYINSRAHVNRFETKLGKYQFIILRLREIYFIDLDGIAALDEIIGQAELRGQKILLTSISPNAINLLEQLSTGYQKLKEDGLIFKKTQDALAYLETHYQINFSKKPAV